MRMHGVVIGSILALSAACSPPPVPVQPAPAPAPGGAGPLRVLLAAPERTAAECLNVARAFAHNALSEKLAAAGYEVTADRPDMTVQLTIDSATCDDSGMHGDVVRLSADTNGRRIFTSGAIPWALDQPGAGAKSSVNAWPTLVNALSSAPEVIALASGKREQGLAGPSSSSDSVTSGIAAPPTPSGSQPVKVAAPQLTAYALVVGIEKYRDLPPPTGARADANAFADTLKATLGIPASQIKVAIDDRAGLADIQRNITWLTTFPPDGSRIYLFYSGDGVKPTEMPHLFERFYRGASSRSAPGSGLGLSLVAAIAEMHGLTCQARDNAPGLAVVIEWRRKG